MKIAYFDCIAGASGDMIMGALLDVGLSEETLRSQLALLHLDDFDLQCRRVDKNGFSAIKVDVLVADNVPARHLADIEAIVTNSDLPTTIKTQAVAIFRRLGAVEAGIHGTSLEQVHLHELGGVDTIVDVVGVLSGLAALGIEQVVVSPLPMGRGFVRGAHGQIPLPAPATLALLKGAPIVGSNLDMELVTPTGAVLLASLATTFGPIPSMTLTEVGYGAGGRDLPIPNVLRLLLGTHGIINTVAADAAGDVAADAANDVAAEIINETLTVLETNIDDLNPEFYDYVMERLFTAGALDVFLSPLQMKKNRPATLLRALCQPESTDPLLEILFSETSTLGVRQHTVNRHSLRRSIHTVETAYGSVRVKIAYWDKWHKKGRKAAPEYEDCRQLAAAKGVPLADVYRAAAQAAAELMK